MRNRNVMKNSDMFSNIFAQTFSSIINNASFVDNLFNSIFSEDIFQRSNLEEGSIRVNIKNEKDKYLIEGVFPGIERKDIRIDYKDDYIYLNVNRNQVYSNGYNMSIVVMQYGDGFSKEFFVPNGDISRMDASFKNHKLRLELPKLKIESFDDNCNIIDVVDFKEE